MYTNVIEFCKRINDKDCVMRIVDSQQARQPVVRLMICSRRQLYHFKIEYIVSEERFACTIWKDTYA